MAKPSGQTDSQARWIKLTHVPGTHNRLIESELNGHDLHFRKRVIQQALYTCKVGDQLLRPGVDYDMFALHDMALAERILYHGCRPDEVKDYFGVQVCGRHCTFHIRRYSLF